MTKREYLKFTCPKCGKNDLEEVMVGVTVFNSIKTISYDEHGELIDWGDCDHEDGSIDRFQCEECGYTIEDKDGMLIRHYDELIEWLKNPVDYLEVVKT